MTVPVSNINTTIDIIAQANGVPLNLTVLAHAKRALTNREAAIGENIRHAARSRFGDSISEDTINALLSNAGLNTQRGESEPLEHGVYVGEPEDETPLTGEVTSVLFEPADAVATFLASLPEDVKVDIHIQRGAS